MSDNQTAPGRIASFAEFFPYYLGEHRDPTCRRLHFAGTTSWLVLFSSAVYAGAMTDPTRLAIGVGGFLVAVTVAFFLEPKMNPLPLVVVAVASMLYADPARFGLAMFAAYGFAWFGHFIIEKNRPATFSYPVWSLAADHVMYFKMLTGKLWSGDSVEATA